MKKFIIIVSVLALASLLLLLLSGAAIGFLVVAAYLLALCFKFPKSRILSSVTARVFVGILGVIGIVQLIAMTIAVLHTTVPAQVYDLTAFAISLCVAVAVYKKSNLSLSLGRVSWLDLALITPALLIASLYTGRVLLPKENNTDSIIRSVAYGVDDTAHLNMYNGLLHSGANLNTFRGSNTQVMAYGYPGYPMGWHQVFATITLGIDSSAAKASMNSIFSYYFMAKVATFFMVILAMTLFAWEFWMRLARKAGFLTYLGLSAVVAFSVLIIVAPMLYDGFFSFFPILLYVSIFAAIALQYNLKERDSLSADVLLVLCIVGSATSWILTGPVLALAYALIMLMSHKALRLIPIQSYLCLAVGLAAFIFQFIALRMAHTDLNVVAASGGIAVPLDILFITTTAAIFGCFAIKPYQETLRPIIIIIVSTFVLMAPVLIYISKTSTVITYYFEKIEVAALILLVPVAAVLLYLFIGKYVDILPQKLYNSVLRIVIFVTLLILSIPGLVGFTYYANTVNNIRNAPVQHQDADYLRTHVYDSDFNGSSVPRVYFYFPDSRPRNILASHIARVGFHDSRCDSRLAVDAGYGPFEKFVTAVNMCATPQDHIIIRTNTEGESQLKAAVKPELITDKYVTFLVGL